MSHEAALPVSDLAPGRRIGRYRLVQCIGAGGMGTVFEAEQDEPRRTVALKLLARAEHPEALARFRYEAEVLGQLSHPGIAQIYESGVERESVGAEVRELPWFAMEHVSGAYTLIDFADGQALGLEARLRLFLRVADAVQYGHEKGVIHRDLKPANLLVDSAGHPKVIDFGIARIAGPEGPQRSMRTSTGQVLGTLRYMSPEQVSGERGGVDLRSDVFALGLVLYELVARRPAYELDGLPLADAVRCVAEARVPALRSVAPGLAAELEWVVQRACAAERERRYPSVASLAADLRRFLEGEVVSAAPPDTLYRLRVFVRRHRLAVGVAGLVLASLSVSLAILARSLRIERGALAAEREERRRAEGNADFLSEMLTSVSPEQDGYEVRVLDVLDRAAPQISQRFADQPLLCSDLHFAVGDAYRNLSRNAEAVEHAQAAFTMRGQVLGPEDPATRAARVLLGTALRAASRWEEAEPLLRASLADSEREEGPRSPTSIRLRVTLIDLLLDSGRLEEARRMLAEALGDSTPETLVLDEQSLLLVDRELRLAVEARDFGLMEAWIQRLERDQPQLSAELQERVAMALQNRGIALVESGRLDEAEAAFRSALERSQPIYGPSSQTCLALRTNLANVALLRSDGETALALLEEALAEAEESLGPEHATTLDIRFALCGALWVSGEKERAAEELAALLETALPLRSAAHVGSAEWASSLGRMYVTLGRLEQAVEQLRCALDVLSAARGDAHESVQGVLRWLVRALDEAGRSEEADAYRPRILAGSR